MDSAFEDKDPSRELLGMQRVLAKHETTAAASSIQPIRGVFASIMDADDKQNLACPLFFFFFQSSPN